MKPCKRLWLVCALTASLGSLGCGESTSDGNGSPSGSIEDYPATELPSTCEVPTAITSAGSHRVVGDGTAASCTNETLQSATTLGGAITFNCGSAPLVIPIRTTLTVEADAIIDGAGQVSLDGRGTTRILAAGNSVQLGLRGLTFTRGSAVDDAELASGGAVRGGWSGSLDIRDCTFTDNEAGANGEEGGGAVYTPSRTTMTIVGCRFEGNRAGTGGAVHNLLSGLTVVNSVFVDNESTTDGGGALYTDGASSETDDAIGGTIALCGCRFTGNIGRKQGGAAYLFAYSPDAVTVNQCIFENNQVLAVGDSGALGGALRIGNAKLDLGQSLFTGNHADSHGGALWVDGNYPSYVTNVTFVGNDAGVPGAKDGGYGGAVSGANLVMTNLTFDSNWAVNSGGAIFNEDQTSLLSNSILLDSRADNEWGIAQTCRKPMAGTHNLQWPAPGTDVACTEEATFADPLLEELLDNGGASQTEAIETGSPAIDQGADCPSIDQRGQPRAEPCDLGAYEG